MFLKKIFYKILLCITCGFSFCFKSPVNSAAIEKHRLDIEAGKSFAVNPVTVVEETVFPSILKNIAISSTSLIIPSLKPAITDLFAFYGIDMRDPTIKYLDKISAEIAQINSRLDKIDATLKKYNAEASLNNLYSYINFAKTDILPKVQGGLWTLYQQELDKSKAAESVESEKKRYFKDALENFTPLSSNIIDFTTHFADYIMKPVPTSMNGLFYYYQLSVGEYDKWSTQSYTNRRNYIATLYSLLISCMNLAIFDYTYRSDAVGDAAKSALKQSLDNMVKRVDSVKELFKTELLRLDEYEKLKDDGTLIYLPTGQKYLSNMDTLTFDPKDKDNQRLIMATTSMRKNQLTLKTWRARNEYIMLYESNHKMVENIVSDYINYKNDFSLENYTLKQYLVDIGFKAKDMKLFNIAAGLYYGKPEITRHGYLNDDLSFNASYYDNYGNLKSKTQFFLECHHKFIVDNTYTLYYKANDYYLCLVNIDTSLDGTYSFAHTTRSSDLQSDLSKGIQNETDYQEASNKYNNWIN